MLKYGEFMCGYRGGHYFHFLLKIQNLIPLLLFLYYKMPKLDIIRNKQ